MGETFHFDAPADHDTVYPLHINCALDHTALHAIDCKYVYMHKDRYSYILHNQLRDLWKRKGVEAGDIVTTESCTDDVLSNQFEPVFLRHAFPKPPSQAVKQTPGKIHELIKQATKPSSNRNALIQEINCLVASTSVKQKGLRVDVLVKFKRLKDVWIDQVCTHATNSSKLLQTAKFVSNAHTAEHNAGAVDLDQYHSCDPSPSVRGSVLTKLRHNGQQCSRPHAQLPSLRPLGRK